MLYESNDNSLKNRWNYEKTFQKAVDKIYLGFVFQLVLRD